MQAAACGMVEEGERQLKIKNVVVTPMQGIDQLTHDSNRMMQSHGASSCTAITD